MGVIVSETLFRRWLALAVLGLVLAATAVVPVSAATPKDVLVIGIASTWTTWTRT